MPAPTFRVFTFELDGKRIYALRVEALSLAAMRAHLDAKFGPGKVRKVRAER